MTKTTLSVIMDATTTERCPHHCSACLGNDPHKLCNWTGEPHPKNWQTAKKEIIPKMIDILRKFRDARSKQADPKKWFSIVEGGSHKIDNKVGADLLHIAATPEGLDAAHNAWMDWIKLSSIFNTEIYYADEPNWSNFDVMWNEFQSKSEYFK